MENEKVHFQDVVRYDDVQDAASDISDNMEYIRDYGYVGFFDCTEEDAIKLNEELVAAIGKALELSDKLYNHVRESFEH